MLAFSLVVAACTGSTDSGAPTDVSTDASIWERYPPNRSVDSAALAAAQSWVSRVDGLEFEDEDQFLLLVRTMCVIGDETGDFNGFFEIAEESDSLRDLGTKEGVDAWVAALMSASQEICPDNSNIAANWLSVVDLPQAAPLTTTTVVSVTSTTAQAATVEVGDGDCGRLDPSDTTYAQVAQAGIVCGRNPAGVGEPNVGAI